MAMTGMSAPVKMPSMAATPVRSGFSEALTRKPGAANTGISRTKFTK